MLVTAFRRALPLVILGLLVGVSGTADSPRILIVGDSWAAGTLGFKAFEQVLAKHDVEGVEVVGATTALGGSRADQWASNHKGKLEALRLALEEHPTIGIVHISIGGNDFLRAAMEEGVVTAAPEARRAVWERIWGDIETLLETIRAIRPGIHILLNDYDYLNPDLMTKTYGMTFPEDVTAETLNRALLECAEFKRAKAEESKRCDYIQHFGVLQHYYGIPPQCEKGALPLPGLPPDYTPFAGGDPSLPNSTDAMPDGVHPMPDGYVHIVERCYQAFYDAWLDEATVEARATK